MAEEAQVLRGINWRETLPFTNIFRAFRVAIHPSKLVLALVALLGLYIGGRVLDGLWPIHDRAIVTPIVATPDFVGPGGAAQMPDVVPRFNITSEIEAYSTDRANFANTRQKMRQDVEDTYARLLQDEGIETDPAKAQVAAAHGEHLREIKARILQRRSAAESKAADARAAALKAADAIKDEPAHHDAVVAANRAYGNAVRDAYTTATVDYQHAETIKGQGIFMQFFVYEVHQFNGVIDGVRFLSPDGIVVSVKNFSVTGPVWLLLHHWVYAILIGIWFLVLWAIFGGAIARIAAVHVARDEKLSVRQALRFSAGKFLSFVFAPLIPLVIVVLIGLVVTLTALIIGNIPLVGPAIIGIFFFLALGAGFVMTLVLFGTIGGFNLMYPTIAVEGSDSFDAISRSFSYVYARPWRMLFYTIVAVIYGALTYLFVHFFVYVLLLLTHYFVNLGLFVHADNGLPLWDVIWHRPTGKLIYNIDYLTLSGAQSFGAAIIACWVYLVIAIVGAFIISFYFSSNTIIYYLMRREVDATESDDVYLEQSEEDFADTVAPPATTTMVTTTTSHTAVVTPDVAPPPATGAMPDPAPSTAAFPVVETPPAAPAPAPHENPPGDKPADAPPTT